MTEEHTILCQRCRKKAPMKQDNVTLSYFPPDGWNRFLGKDLCPACYRSCERVLAKHLKLPLKEELIFKNKTSRALDFTWKYYEDKLQVEISERPIRKIKWL